MGSPWRLSVLAVDLGFVMAKRETEKRRCQWEDDSGCRCRNWAVSGYKYCPRHIKWVRVLMKRTGYLQELPPGVRAAEGE